MCDPQPSPSILDHFSALSDPRQSWRVLYPLPEILLLVLCATVSGMEDFVEISLWREQRLDFLQCSLPYERGIPAHDTLNDVPAQPLSIRVARSRLEYYGSRQVFAVLVTGSSGGGKSAINVWSRVPPLRRRNIRRPAPECANLRSNGSQRCRQGIGEG
jgi:hypothetical protein